MRGTHGERLRTEGGNNRERRAAEPSDRRSLAPAVPPASLPCEIIGASDAIRRTQEAIALVASSDVTVLLTGETGTGKNLVADAIHARSSRSLRPCIRVDCSAICTALFESELFGHVRGAFTGAVAARVGRFEVAADGTVFLDEIGELSLEAQGRLLRIIEERTYERVGDNRTLRVEARVIAATSRDLRREVARGRFRPELFYRLNVFPIHLPPLRERKADIPDLVQHFLASSARHTGRKVLRIDERALERLQSHHWPGNVRELQNALEHAVVLTKAALIEPAALPERITRRRREPLVAERSSPNPSLEVIERAYIMWVLQAEGGNKTRAAEVLGIDPSTLYRKLSRYEEQPAAV